jgi:hypothetical protein
MAKDLLEESVAELQRMKLEAENSGDAALSLNIQKEIHKIVGLHMDRIDVTSGGNTIESISVIKLVEVKKDKKEEL